MTAELSALEPPPGGWTTNDLDELPESNRHYELIDGALIVSPSATNVHQMTAALLTVMLQQSCPADYELTQGVEVRVSRTRSFIPDVLVTTAAAARQRTATFAPHEVVIAVEITSPSSVAMDAVTKPALYAQAGIPFFWRVETTPRIVVHTYRLDLADTVYQPAGTFDKVVKVDEPWRIEFPTSRITPRFLASD